jgi:hypothetical protein
VAAGAVHGIIGCAPRIAAGARPADRRSLVLPTTGDERSQIVVGSRPPGSGISRARRGSPTHAGATVSAGYNASGRAS